MSGESRVAGKTHKSCNFIFFFLLCVHSNMEFLLFVIFNRKAFFFSVAATKHFFSVFICFFFRALQCNRTNRLFYRIFFSPNGTFLFSFEIRFKSKKHPATFLRLIFQRIPFEPFFQWWFLSSDEESRYQGENF